VELTAAYPDRCVWGSDWPHTPPHGEGEGRLQPSPFQTISARRHADLILGALDGATRNAVLKDNPQRLYAFGAIDADAARPEGVKPRPGPERSP
jgi:predicted TIM-barrel fold metal-dependent hydrolase